MANYTQLQEKDRLGIFRGLTAGMTRSAIADQTGRHKSTISRELRRNSDHVGYLYPKDAHHQANRRKARHGSKINRNPAMKAYILEKIKLGWSPSAIAGRWSKEHPKKRLSAETIYKYAYRKEMSTLRLWEKFPRAKPKRGLKRRRLSKSTIMHRVSIYERPKEVETRKTLGHYEADLMFVRGNQSANVLTIVERKSRMVSLVKHISKKSAPIIQSLKKKVGAHAQSITFDNGSEFALHHTLGVSTFFCNPGSPWQKGSIENMNGLLRYHIPFSMNSELITQEYLDQIAHIMNTKPRKILGFLTPLEVFNREQKKLKKESRVKPAKPAVEVAYQNSSFVALHC